MEVEVEHIRSRKRRGGERADKQLVDHSIALGAHSGRRACGRMGRNDQAHLWSSGCQRDGRTIVEGPCRAALWMGAHVIWGTRKGLLDHLQIQQVVSATSRNDAEAS